MHIILGLVAKIAKFTKKNKCFPIFFRLFSFFSHGVDVGLAESVGGNSLEGNVFFRRNMVWRGRQPVPLCALVFRRWRVGRRGFVLLAI